MLDGDGVDSPAYVGAGAQLRGVGPGPDCDAVPLGAGRVPEQRVPDAQQHQGCDTIFKTIPGFLADLSPGPFSASVGYRAEILNYVTLTDQNTMN